LYRDPTQADWDATALPEDESGPPKLTDAQRRVLVELCRPFKNGAAFATPATNQQVADALVLSVDAVKTHIRALFVRFGVEDLPQNQKRVRLAELGLQTGAVHEHEL